ncbi:hypothetical protein EZS27_011665 [termite gut metagenome]|uniref:Uncharacterized protein n=1 Tax=termite gut metagenome TaxID=433724 RepID=A0A5J4S5F9_9ZZZZ
MSSTLVCIKAFKINFKFIPQILKCSIGCVKQSFFLYIIFRHYPFLLQLTPNGFGNIQMRRTGRRKVQKQSSMLPIGYPLSNDIGFMYAGIIQYNNSFLINFKRKFFRIFQYEPGVYVLFRSCPVAFTLPVYKPKTVYPFGFLTKHTNFFMGKLPAIGNITFSTYLRFISIKKLYLPLLTQFLKFFELFQLIFIISRPGLALTAKSYAFVSYTGLFKKRTSVLRITDFTLCNDFVATIVKTVFFLSIVA